MAKKKTAKAPVKCEPKCLNWWPWLVLVLGALWLLNDWGWFTWGANLGNWYSWAFFLVGLKWVME